MQIISTGDDGVIMVWDLNKVPEDGGTGGGKLRRKKVRKRPSALTAQISSFKAYDRKFRPIYIIYPEFPSGKTSTKLTALSLHIDPIQYQLDTDVDPLTAHKVEEGISGEKVGSKGTEEPFQIHKESNEKLIAVTRPSTAPENTEGTQALNEEKQPSNKAGGTSSEVIKKESELTRQIYRPVLVSPKEEPKKIIQVANDEGDVITLRWEGFDFHKGEEITTEQGNILSWAETVHDGPVVTCARSPFMDDLTLTVGGRVIALWRQDLKNQPLFCKNSTVGITCGSWSPHRPCVFHVGRSDGSIEVWDLARSSDTPTFVQSISGKVLTTMADHPLPLPGQSVLGVGDYNNSFRLLYFPEEMETALPDELQTLKDIVGREVNVRQTYAVWNESFIKSNAEELARMQAKEEEAERIRREAEVAAEQEAQLRAKLEEEESKLLAKGRQGNTLDDRFLERLKAEREKQMQRVLMEKKRLNKSDLIAKQQPILQIKQMEKEKRKKQKEKIKQQQKIFDKTVAMLFPEVVEKSEEGPSRIDEFEAELMEHKGDLLSQYDVLLPVELKFIRDNPFNKRLKWEKVFEEGMFRRNVLDFPLYLRQKRRERYLNTTVSSDGHIYEKKKKVEFRQSSTPLKSEVGEEESGEGEEESIDDYVKEGQEKEGEEETE